MLCLPHRKKHSALWGLCKRLTIFNKTQQSQEKQQQTRETKSKEGQRDQRSGGSSNWAGNYHCDDSGGKIISRAGKQQWE